MRLSPASNAAPRMGYARFNAVLGERQTLLHAEWIGKDSIARWLVELPQEANSGDVYALLE